MYLLKCTKDKNHRSKNREADQLVRIKSRVEKKSLGVGGEGKENVPCVIICDVSGSRDPSRCEDEARLYTDGRLGEEYFLCWKKTFINSGAKKETRIGVQESGWRFSLRPSPPFPAYNLIQSFRQGG